MEQQKQWYRENLTLRAQVIVDVGANVGALSQFFWDHCGPQSRLVSIEPHPDNIKALSKRIRKAASKRWTLKRCAVSSRHGTVALRELEMTGGHNAMVVDDAADFTVPCMPLCQLTPQATVVKLDVEGHEYSILPEAVPVLSHVSAWAVELHMVAGHALDTTLKLFVDHGFELVGAGRKADDESRWLNVAIAPSLGWNDVPGLASRRNGQPRTSKMLHIIARR